MRKIALITLALVSLWACSKDDDSSDDDSNNYSVSATIDGNSFSISQNSVGLSAASSGGTSQLNATSSDKGLKFFIPETTTNGSQDLDTSAIGITYSNDWTVFGNYILNRGSINITKFEPWPIVMKATFQGWGYNNTDPDDSIYINNGVVNINLNQ